MSESLQVQEPKGLVKISEGRPMYPVRAKEEFGVGPAEWRVLIDSIFPGAETTEGIVLALSYCRARKLDVFKRPLHIVPMWNSKLRRNVETVWPGINELLTTAARTGQYAGCKPTEFGPAVERTFSGRVSEQAVDAKVTFPEWAMCTVLRLLPNGAVGEFPGPKVFWLETYARRGKSEVPNDMWCRRSYGQLDKCARAAALRAAFPEELGNEFTVDEAQTFEGAEAPAKAMPEIVSTARSAVARIVEEAKPKVVEVPQEATEAPLEAEVLEPEGEPTPEPDPEPEAHPEVDAEDAQMLRAYAEEKLGALYAPTFLAGWMSERRKGSQDLTALTGQEYMALRKDLDLEAEKQANLSQYDKKPKVRR